MRRGSLPTVLDEFILSPKLRGVVMDIIYQLVFLGEFFPAEAAIVAVLLAFVPYALLRGPIARVARHWTIRPTSGCCPAKPRVT